MIHLATFSDDQMSRSRALCIESALKHGVDYIAGPHYFDPALETRDGFTLEWLKSQPIYGQMGADWWTNRGVGYWLWKPYIIDQLLNKLSVGDVVVYADAGIEFIDNVRHIVERMGQDVFLFGNNWEHAHWCKRDVIDAVWPWPSLSHEQRIAAIERLEARGDRKALAKLDSLLTSEADIPDPTWGRFGKQAQASVILLRVSDYSRAFVAEWLKWCLHRERYSTICTDEWRYLIDDSPSILPNHPEFREHRHDQAILTTLAYREGIKLHRWPSVYNRFVGPEFVYEKLPCYAGDMYPPIFHHHRLRNHDFDAIRPSMETHVSV